MAGKDGKVYVFKQGDSYKVGQSVDPGNRLHGVRGGTHPNAVKVATFDARNMAHAESKAQRRVETEFGMKKDGNSDWYKDVRGTSDSAVENAVGSAVQSSNDKQ